MAHLQNTLEGAGFAYNPFTTSDIWGVPGMLNLPAITNSELRVGADDSAIPQLANPSFGRADYLGGSSVYNGPVMHTAPLGPPQSYGSNAQEHTQQHVHIPTAKENNLNLNAVSLGLFAAVLAAALYFQRT